jgi:hypothetical protein
MVYLFAATFLTGVAVGVGAYWWLTGANDEMDAVEEAEEILRGYRRRVR